MNIVMFNKVIAPLVEAAMPVKSVTFFPDGDDLKVVVALPSDNKTFVQVAVCITETDIDIYSVKFQSIVSFITDKIWQALKDSKPTKQEPK